MPSTKRCPIPRVSTPTNFFGVLVTFMYSGLAGRLLFVARVALLACVGELTFIVRLCLRCFPALVSDCPYIPNHCVSL